MSLSRVNKRIRDLSLRLDNGYLRKIPVLLTDSRGRDLEQVVNPQKYPENKIYFWYQRGVGVEERFEWLKQNLQSKFQELGSNHITLYVWIGTCDLTKKTNNFIELRTQDYTTVRYICKFYKEIHDYVRQFPTINIVFLELPFYSIFLWNLHHNHVNPQSFREQDKLLEQQITEVNKYINQLNILHHQNSPSFSHDLEKSRKRRHEQSATYSFNYGLYLDGVHPHPDLAKLWLIRIALRLPNDCK